MIGVINDGIINLDLDKIFDITILDGIVDQISVMPPEYGVKVNAIIDEFKAFNVTFESEKAKFKDYLENDLYYGVSLELLVINSYLINT